MDLDDFSGSKVRLVTLDIAIQLLKSLVLRPDGSSALQDNHFAEMEGVREESTLLLRNFYKVRCIHACSCSPFPMTIENGNDFLISQISVGGVVQLLFQAQSFD